jgi:hypothetical protein
MSAIFISHSSLDNEFCKRLMAWLETLGHRSLFLDFDASAGIEGGCNLHVHSSQSRRDGRL